MILFRIVIAGVVIFLLWWADSNPCNYFSGNDQECEAQIAEESEAAGSGCTIDPLTGLMQGSCK